MARLGGLFDNNEDDDSLFGASNFGFGLGPSTAKSSEPAKVNIHNAVRPMDYIHAMYVCTVAVTYD